MRKTITGAGISMFIIIVIIIIIIITVGACVVLLSWTLHTGGIQKRVNPSSKTGGELMSLGRVHPELFHATADGGLRFVAQTYLPPLLLDASIFR
jgi:flagellar basal body-associated protein FliL